MKVRLTTDRVGGGFFQIAGDVIEVESGEGQRLIASRQAEPVSSSEPETAMIAATEQTMSLPRSKPRKNSHA